MSEYSLVEDVLDFKKFLSANGAYRKSVAVAFVGLVYIFFRDNIHSTYSCRKIKSKFPNYKIFQQ